MLLQTDHGQSQSCVRKPPPLQFYLSISILFVKNPTKNSDA